MKIGNYTLFEKTPAQESLAVSGKETGATGTNNYHGFIGEEFTEELKNEKGIVLYNKMRRSDATVAALLRAIKLYIIKANWFIQSGDEEAEPRMEELTEYATNLFFKYLDEPFKEKIRLSANYLDFGVVAFETVFQIKEDKLYLKKLAYRQPSSYYSWELDNGEKGLMQSLPTPETGKPWNPQIPYNKLLLFQNEKEGDNEWAVSILRPAYKHWWFKDFAYRLDMMANEKWAMGIPAIHLPVNFTPEDVAKAEEMGRNMRTNEQAYAVLLDGWSIEVITGEKDEEGLFKTIEHHDRLIVKSVLAQVLNMGQETGTQSLGDTMMEFFIEGIQAYAQHIADRMNELLKKLIRINFGEVESYPELTFTNIKNENIAGLSEAVAKLATGGFISPDGKLEDYLRDIMNFPERDETEVSPEMPVKEEKPVMPAKVEDVDTDEPEVKKPDPKAQKKMMQFTEIKPTEREKIFVQDITDMENYLQEHWKQTEEVIVKYEGKIREYLAKGYAMADTDKLGGVTVLKKAGNAALQTKMIAGLKDILEKMKNKLYSKEVTHRLIQKAGKEGLKTYRNLKRLAKYAEIQIPESQLRSFEAGYISNMKGNIEDGDGRRMVEVVIENFGGQAPLVEVMRGVERLSFNRNNLKLSNLTHIRGAYKTTILTNSLNDGFVHYKMVIPKGIELDKAGETMKYLFLIGTLSYWASRREDTTGNPMATSFHHNSQEQYLPIEEEEMEYEEMIAQEQRKSL